LNCHASIFLASSQKTGLSEECNKDVKLASREPIDFIVSSCFMPPENKKIFQILQAGMILRVSCRNTM
jgi:hypothetical protein